MSQSGSLSGSGGGGGMGLIAWTDEATSFMATSNNGYFATAALTATLPPAPMQGDLIGIYADTTGSVVIQANTGQQIRLGNVITSSGMASNTRQGDVLLLIYRSISATWDAVSAIGTWGLT